LKKRIGAGKIWGGPSAKVPKHTSYRPDITENGGGFQTKKRNGWGSLQGNFHSLSRELSRGSGEGCVTARPNWQMIP